jgi:hypothetical protein
MALTTSFSQIQRIAQRVERLQVEAVDVGFDQRGLGHLVSDAKLRAATKLA